MASLVPFLRAVKRDVINPVAHAVNNVQHAAGNVAHAGNNVVNAVQAAPRVVNREIQQAPAQVVRNVVAPAVRFVPQFAENYSNTFANLGAKAANNTPVIRQGGAGIGGRQVEPKTIQQNMGGNALLDKTLKFSQATGKNKQLAGDVAQIGLSTLPGVGKGASLGTKAVVGGLTNAGFSFASTLGDGGTAKQALKSAAINGTIGAAIPLAGRIAGTVAPKAAGRVLDTLERKPVPKVSDKELAAATRVSMARSGFPDNTKPGDVASYRNVQAKLKVPVNDHASVDDLINARMTHEVHMQQVKQKFSSLPIGLGTQDVSKLPLKDEPFIAPSKLVVPKVTTNSLTSKVKGQNLSPEAAAQVSGEGIVRNTKDLQDTAIKQADAQGLDKTIQTAHESLAVEPGKIDDTTVAHVQQAIERADAAGRTQDAVGLHDALSEHLRKQGQTIQAASLLYRLSPNGLFYKASRDLGKAGVDLKKNPELETKLRNQVEAIKAAKNPDEKQLATATLHKTVADNIPQGKAQNALSVWKAGLLSGPITQAGNLASNGTFAALHGASNPLAAGIDKIISLKTGERTKTLTGKGILSGGKKGIGTGINTMKTGIDARNIEGTKYEIHGELNFKNPVIQKVFGTPSNLVFRGMSAADQPFYYSALKNNLADVAKADGINRGLKGKDLSDHITKMVDSPTTKMAETAKLAAQKSVLSQDNQFASALSKFSQSHAALQAVIPFVKVPTNFLVRSLDFTPVGAAKEAFTQIRAGKLDQRALSEALSEATTGTAVIALGAELANSKMLSGQYPSSDQKEVQRWKAEGIQANSVKVGNKWVNLNYLGPVGLLLGAGKDYHDAVAQGNNGVAASIAGAGKSLAGQSFLTGFSGAANAINDPGRYGANFINSQGGSVIPSWANALANATDSNQRQANNIPQTIQSRVPGARNSLPVKQDVYGNPLKQRANPLDMTLNPLKPSNDLSQKNPVVSEVDRLHNVDPNNSDLQVTPTPVSKNISIPAAQKGEKATTVKLTPTQQQALQKQVGQLTQSKWNELIQSPEYKALDDTGKAKALNNLRTDSTTLATRQFVLDNNLGNYAKSPNAKVIALGEGTSTAGDYAKATTASTGGSKVKLAPKLAGSDAKTLTQYQNAEARTKAFNATPDAEYKYAQAQYNNNKAKGTLTTAQDIQAQSTLAKLKAGASTDKTTRDLYNLSKAQIYSYITTNKDGNKVASDLKAYDQALYDSGINSSLKFKNGFTTKTASGNSSGGRKAAKFKTIAAPKFKTDAIKAPRLKTVRIAKAKKLSVAKVNYSTKAITPRLRSKSGVA